MRHPLVGEFDLVHEPMMLPLPGCARMRLNPYHAEPGSRSEEVLRMPAS